MRLDVRRGRPKCPDCGTLQTRAYSKRIEQKVMYECLRCTHMWEEDMQVALDRQAKAFADGKFPAYGSRNQG